MVISSEHHSLNAFQPCDVLCNMRSWCGRHTSLLPGGNSALGIALLGKRTLSLLARPLTHINNHTAAACASVTRTITCVKKTVARKRMRLTTAAAAASAPTAAPPRALVAAEQYRANEQSLTLSKRRKHQRRTRQGAIASRAISLRKTASAKAAYSVLSRWRTCAARQNRVVIVTAAASNVRARQACWRNSSILARLCLAQRRTSRYPHSLA